MTEEEVIQKVGEVLRKNNASPIITEFMIDKVKTTCIACKFGERCFKEKKIYPYQPKCDKHEYMEEIKV